MSGTNIAKPDSSSHWYLVEPNGVKAFHHVPYAGKRGANGEMRSTNLRDARKVGALPSVTNILQVLEKPFLTAYKVNQAILACTTLPKVENESVDDFAKRALRDSKEHASSAAKLGSACHEIGALVLCDPHNETFRALNPVDLPAHNDGRIWLYDREASEASSSLPSHYIKVPATLGDHIGEMVNGRPLIEVAMPLIKLIQSITPNEHPTDKRFAEFHIAHEGIGYAGCCDGLIFLDPNNSYVRDKLHDAGYGHLIDPSKGPQCYDPVLAVMDTKTRGGTDPKKIPIYETDILQLAAYLNALPETKSLGRPNFNSHNTPVCNLMLNTNKNAGENGLWQAELVIHNKEEVDMAWEAFQHLHAVWCWLRKYDPTAKPAQ